MPEPLFRVVRGRLDPFETAAVTVVLAALTARADHSRAAGEPSRSGAGVRHCGPWRADAGRYQPPGSWSAPTWGRR